MGFTRSKCKPIWPSRTYFLKILYSINKDSEVFTGIKKAEELVKKEKQEVREYLKEKRIELTDEDDFDEIFDGTKKEDE